MSNKRVLIVDDNVTNLKLITCLLATESCDVITATSAEHALELLRDNRPDLLLLDLQLPDMDGLELTRILRADPVLASLPIVAVTAYAMKGDEERARAAGVDSYVTKPIAKDEFRRVVSMFLKGEASA
jgi:two-component system, cell cycle response regulator DivK